MSKLLTQQFLDVLTPLEAEHPHLSALMNDFDLMEKIVKGFAPLAVRQHNAQSRARRKAHEKEMYL